MDSELKFSSHSMTITKSASCHLKSTSRVKGLMSRQDLEKLVHTFIFSRLNYEPKTVDHITPVLRSLHWLPVCQRIDFKILLLVYKALNGFGPEYISDLLLHYKPPRPLRSSGTGPLLVPGVKTKHGEAAFSYYAPHIWNKLPENCRSAPTLTAFKSRRNTFLLAAAFNWSSFKSLNCSMTFIIFYFSLLFFKFVSLFLLVFECNF